MKVNICGVPHEVIECEDSFDIDCHMGMIDHKNAIIKINKDIKGVNRKETICHEMAHGMLLHMGYDELCNNEQFVQALGNAIMQGFDIKEVKSSYDDISNFEPCPFTHDGCKGCEYESYGEGLQPCKSCKQSYIDKYTPKKK